jgi:hypothetical protein
MAKRPTNAPEQHGWLRVGRESRQRFAIPEMEDTLMAKKRKGARSTPDVRVKPILRRPISLAPRIAWSDPAKAAAWADPEIVWFAGEERLQTLPGIVTFAEPGVHGLSHIFGNIFGRRKEDVEADWKKVCGQITSIIDNELPVAKDFSLDEVTFDLGFSAEGHLLFIAQAGVKTSISVKFTRRKASN